MTYVNKYALIWGVKKHLRGYTHVCQFVNDIIVIIFACRYFDPKVFLKFLLSGTLQAQGSELYPRQKGEKTALESAENHT